MLGGQPSAVKLRPYGTLHCIKTDLTIASGATTSNALDTQGYPVTGFILPSTFDGTALAIHASDAEAGTYVPLYDSDGNAIAMVVAASRAVGLTGVDGQAISAFRWIKLVADAQATTDTVIQAILKG